MLRIIRRFAFFYHGLSSGGLGDLFDEPVTDLLRSHDASSHRFGVFRIQDLYTVLRGKILELSKSVVITDDEQLLPRLFMKDNTVLQPFLYRTGICPHQSACSKQGSAKVSRHHHTYIMDLCTGDHIQHGPARRNSGGGR